MKVLAIPGMKHFKKEDKMPIRTTKTKTRKAITSIVAAILVAAASMVFALGVTIGATTQQASAQEAASRNFCFNFEVILFPHDPSLRGSDCYRTPKQCEEGKSSIVDRLEDDVFFITVTSDCYNRHSRGNAP